MRKRASSDIDHALRQIAERQLGLVSATQAACAGVSADALAHRRTVGMLEPVFPRVMRLVGSPPPPHQRALAAALAVPGSCITGPSAGAILELPCGAATAAAEHSGDVVITVTSAQVVRLSGIRTIRQTHAFPSRPWMNVRVSNPAATIVTLPRFVDEATVERCLDHCLAHRLLSVNTVRTLIDSYPSQSVVGRTLLMELLHARADGIGHRSRLEQRTGGWLNSGGLSGWCRNHNVHVGGGKFVEVDFAWVASKVALEVSPFFTHGSRAGQRRDMVRRRLLIQAGWTVIEAGDSDLVDRASFAAVLQDLKRQVVR